MELFERVNSDALDETSWLTPDSNSPEYDFDPNIYLFNPGELESMDLQTNILTIPKNETTFLNKSEILVDPISASSKAVLEYEPQHNESTRKRPVASQQVPRSIASEDDEEDALSSSRSLPKVITVTRLNGNKRKLAVSSKHNPSTNNSEDEDEAYPCQPNMSKNAVAARENRLKKKRYIEGLEKSVDTLRSKNNQLESKVNKLEGENKQLRDEVEYLRNVLANSEDIAILIDSIKTVNQVKSQNIKNSSLKQHDYYKSPIEDSKMSTRSSNKRKLGEASGNQENNFKKVKTSGNRPTLGGVCLHVNNGKLALECCVRCSVSASNKGLK